MRIEQRHKNLTTKIGWGWDRRVKSPQEYTIVIHTTNGRQGSSFQAELSFLLTSPDVSAHYLVGKDGRIVETLPVALRAWHAGRASKPEYSNNYTIGIEQHYTPNEPNIPILKTTTYDLARHLMIAHRIKDVVMHRTIAVPVGRKIDPSNFTDSEFEAWREITFSPLLRKLITRGATVWTSPDFNHPVAAHITNERINQGIVRHSYIEDVKRVAIDWYWITSGIGFVESRFVL
jgi:hypothetical protein